MTHGMKRHPLLSFVVAVLALYLAYNLIPDEFEHRVDVVLTLCLTGAFLWAVGLMIRRTRVWTPRGLGLLGTVTGDALLYMALGFGAALGYRTQVLDLARSCLTLGVVLLLIGLTRSTRHREDDAPVIVENVEEPTPQPSATNLEELKKGGPTA